MTVPEITEALIIRDLQPTDVVVLRVDGLTSNENIMKICEVMTASLGCRVVALRGDDITIESIRDDR
jgi:3-dehydroquinate dehydratase